MTCERCSDLKSSLAEARALLERVADPVGFTLLGEVDAWLAANPESPRAHCPEHGAVAVVVNEAFYRCGCRRYPESPRAFGVFSVRHGGRSKNYPGTYSTREDAQAAIGPNLEGEMARMHRDVYEVLEFDAESPRAAATAPTRCVCGAEMAGGPCLCEPDRAAAERAVLDEARALLKDIFDNYEARRDVDQAIETYFAANPEVKS